MRKTAMGALFVIALVSAAGFAGASQKQQQKDLSEGGTWSSAYGRSGGQAGDSLTSAEWESFDSGNNVVDEQGNTLVYIGGGNKGARDDLTDCFNWPPYNSDDDCNFGYNLRDSDGDHLSGVRHRFNYDTEEWESIEWIPRAKCSGGAATGDYRAHAACHLFDVSCLGAAYVANGTFTIPISTSYTCQAWAAGSQCRTLCTTYSGQSCTVTTN